MTFNARYTLKPNHKVFKNKSVPVIFLNKMTRVEMYTLNKYLKI